MTIAFPSEEVARATTAPTTDNEQLTTDTPPLKRPISERKRAANRANAAKSTGPRTTEGKKTVSQNATTHGLTATPDPKIFLDPNYDARRYELTKEFRPTSPAQTYLVEQLVLIGHKLDQIPILESHLLAQAAFEISNAEISNLKSEIPPTEFSLSEISNLKSEIPPQPNPTSAINLPSLIAHEFLKDKPTPLTRLYDFHRRLQSRFQSIIRQIHQLQKNQSIQHTHDLGEETAKEREARIAKDHAALKEELDRIHQKNKQKAEEQRQQRNREPNNLPPPQPFSGRACPTGLTAPAQIKPTPPPPSPPDTTNPYTNWAL